jgi:histidinol-phosphatase
VSWAADLALAQRMADAADSITLAAAGRLASLRVERKADASPVSEADRAAERALRALAAAERPGDGFLGEEDGGTWAGEADRRWLVDPIDGTRDFLAGTDAWETLIALEADGRVVVAVISAPARRARWWAVAGGGAVRDGRPRAVSGVATLAQARWSTYLPDPDRGRLPRIAEMRRRAGVLRGPHTYTAVIDGDCDVAFDLYGEEWDFAAPKLIVEEAGGRMTDLAGGERLDTGAMVASNGRLHAAALALLAR